MRNGRLQKVPVPYNQIMNITGVYNTHASALGPFRHVGRGGGR
ncbi:hypothetical protein [Streptomyces sp. P9-A4]